MEVDTDSEPDHNDFLEDPPLRPPFTLTFTNLHHPPKPNEFVISNRETVLRENFDLSCGNYLEDVKSINCIVTSDHLFKITDTNTIVIEMEDQAISLFTLCKHEDKRKPQSRQFFVIGNMTTFKVRQYDENTFDMLSDDYGHQSFRTKRIICKDCNEPYSFKPLHIKNNTHLGAAYIRRLTIRRRDVTVTPNEVNIFFDAFQNAIQKWKVKSTGDIHALDLHTPDDKNQKWLGIIYLHAHQGIELQTDREITTFDNMVQRIDMGGERIKEGHNKSMVKLKSNKPEPMEALVPILYEIRQEDGNKIYLRQTLHVSKDYQQNHHLEALEPVTEPPPPDQTKNGPTSTLGRNYLKHPSHYEARLFHPKVLAAVEATTTRTGLKEDKLPQIAIDFKLTEEEKILVAINIATLKKPLNKTTYVDKLLLNVFLELTRNNQNHFGYMARPIDSMSQIPGTQSSRVFLDVDRAALIRLNIKNGNRVILETGTGRLTGNLEVTGDKTSAFIVHESPDKIDKWSSVSIVKRDNYFLNLAYYSVLHLVKENPHIKEYLFQQEPPQLKANNQPIQFLQSNLTNEQQEAVTKTLHNKPSAPAILTGPAGTGKSLVLAEIGLQIAKNKGKVLYISPTNQGIASLYMIVRALAEFHFGDELRLIKVSSPTVPITENCDLCYKDEVGTSHRYPPTLEIKNCDIVFATPTVAMRLGFLETNKPNFEGILVDEICFMTEPEGLCAIAPFINQDPNKNPFIILAGDPKQLHYCPRSQAAKLGGLEIDLMTRMIQLPAYKKGEVITHLYKNFRNDELITSILNTIVYENRILCMTGPTKGRIAAIHTVGITDRPVNDRSSYNPIDAVICLREARKEQLKNPDKKIIVLCLYKAQLALMLRMQQNEPPYTRIECITTESIQGSQADGVLISPSLAGIYPHEIPRSEWPTSISRIAMSISRAKTSFTLVGNLLLLNKIPAYSYLIEIAEKTNNLSCDGHIKTIIRHDRLKQII